MRSRDGAPIWVEEAGGKAVALSRVDLGGKAETSLYDEKWLQDLLHSHPAVFPIEHIEPGYGPLIPLCRDLKVQFGADRTGDIDNLFVTDRGGLALIEAKLWRNPEARRTAVAQAMDYAAAIFRMSYEQLERAVVAARAAYCEGGASLVKFVTYSGGGCDEAEFIDALSRNLLRGRAVIALVGDGIREDVLPLAELLQSHAGHRFTFALVELAIYEAPSSGVRIVSPSVLAQTALIERGVIRIDGDYGAVRVEMPEPSATTTAAAKRRAIGLNEDEYFELLGNKNPDWPNLVRSFMAKAEALGIYPDVQGGLNLKHSAPSGRPLNLATIMRDGIIDTGPSSWQDRGAAGHRYSEELAPLIGGLTHTKANGSESGLRTRDGKMPRVNDLLPAHDEAWLAAMERYIAEFRDAGQNEAD